MAIFNGILIFGTTATLTQCAVAGGNAVYSYSSVSGQVPFVGQSIVITGFVASTGANNVTATITAASGGASGTFTVVATTQVNETHSGTGTGAAVAQITAGVFAADGATPFPAGAFAWRIEVEPLRANTHVSYVGLSNVSNSSTLTNIQELAAPVSGTPLDRFIYQASGGQRNFDLGDFWVAGTTAEKIKASVWTS
jgi:hypothetical protein